MDDVMGDTMFEEVCGVMLAEAVELHRPQVGVVDLNDLLLERY